jgi:Na+-transporting methylmalonyl-CoA/oxaloacetate decarboxylase gamma subunit
MDRFSEIISPYIPNYLTLMVIGVGSGFILGLILYLIMWGISEALSLIRKF